MKIELYKLAGFIDLWPGSNYSLWFCQLGCLTDIFLGQLTALKLNETRRKTNMFIRWWNREWLQIGIRKKTMTINCTVGDRNNESNRIEWDEKYEMHAPTYWRWTNRTCKFMCMFYLVLNWVCVWVHTISVRGSGLAIANRWFYSENGEKNQINFG